MNRREIYTDYFQCTKYVKPKRKKKKKKKLRILLPKLKSLVTCQQKIIIYTSKSYQLNKSEILSHYIM